ncbi:MAG: serine/threonine-protein kinase [Thermomonas sp.]
MDAERWQRLSPLLDALLELDAETRARSLALMREEDPQTADDLEALLADEAGNSEFLSEPLLAAPGPRPDASIGPYRLERLLGEGGMGQVWMACRDDGLYQRRVALKLLRPGLADPNLRLRFTRERQILARLEHANIARLLDAGATQDGQPYLALEYVDGEPITDWCAQRQPPLQQRLALFLQTCDAVSHAHANLIVHRDLKPSNILVTALDDVRLLDFGIAKLLDNPEAMLDNTRTGLRAFTLHYAAPEQIRGEPVTTMTDVYSLGVVLYELLTGSKPYKPRRPTDAEWEEAILHADPQRPSQALQRAADADPAHGHALRRFARQVAGDLDNIVLKALAKQPERRYPSVEALAQDIRRFLDGKPVQARPHSVEYRLRKYVHRHRWALSTALLVLLVLSTALGIVAWQARQALREAARAQAMQDFVVGLFQNAGEAPNPGNIDVRRLLAAGIERGDRELAHQPEARAELYGVVARLRIGLGDYRAAYDLLRREVLVVATLDDPPPGLMLALYTDIGHAQRLLARPDECLQTLQPLEARAHREQARLPVQAADFYSEFGRCKRRAGDRDGAAILFERALSIRRGTLDDDTGAIENLADLADLRKDAADNAGALRGYRDALSRLQAGPGMRHPLAVELLRNICALERIEGDMAAAQRDCQRALSLADSVLGPQHRETIDAGRQWAAMLVDLGRLREAEAAFDHSRTWLAERLGANSEDVAIDDNSLAIVDWERGDIPAALASIDRAIATWSDSGQPLRLASVLFNKALILHDVHRDAEALPLVERSRRLRAPLLGGNHALVGESDRLLGDIHAALGDPGAEAELQRAVRILDAAYGPARASARRAQLSLAAFRAQRGDAAALAQLDALGDLRADDFELRKVAWLARAEAAGLRCHGPQRGTAITALHKLDGELRTALPEGGSVARDVAAIAARCR